MVFSINAWCRRLGKALSANSAKAREKVASLGISLLPVHPHSRRSARSIANRSISARFGARDEPSRATVRPVAESWTSIMVWPPRPDAAGSHTPRASAAATAASTALPPRSSI